MVTRVRDSFIQSAALAPGANTNLLGTTVRYDQFDMSYHWQEMMIVLSLTANATAPSTLTLDGLLNACRNIRLEVNRGSPETIVNSSGIGLLEYVAAAAQNLDPATLAFVAEHTKGTPALTASNLYRLTYRIPFVHPRITEPLRTRMLLDVPEHQSSPILTLDFNSAANMYGAGTLDAIQAEVFLVRREVPAALHASIIKDGGYMPFDLIESSFQLATGISGEQHIPLNQPGAYGSLLTRFYKGGSSITRADPSNNVTVGQETKWRFQAGTQTFKEWRNKFAQGQSYWSRVLNSAVQSSSPAIASALASSTQYPPLVGVYHDFLTGNGISDSADLGSVLDCFLPANPGQRMELIGDMASVATNGSTIYMLGHRYKDRNLIAKFQAAG